MNDDFDALDKLGEVCGILDGLAVEYEIHQRDEGEYSYLKEDEACITIPNPNSLDVPEPYTGRTIYIDFQDEISLFFAVEWHAHYSLNESDYDEFKQTLVGILKNELCNVTLFEGEDRSWGGSLIVSKTEACEKSAEEIFAEPFPELAAEYRRSWKENGAEIYFIFRDPVDDVKVVVEKQAKS